MLRNNLSPMGIGAEDPFASPQTKNAQLVSLVGAIDSIAQGGAVIQVPNLGQNLQNGNKINSEHSVHSV